MADIVDRSTRSRIMASIGPKDTVPERVLRRFLHQAGFRFRLHQRHLAGKPDLVLPKYGAVLFVHGCFWHRHKNCADAVVPSSNTAFWKKKLAANQRRDKAQIAALRAEGWRVGVFWECAARKGVADERTLRAVAGWLRRGTGYRDFPLIPLRTRRRTGS